MVNDLKDLLRENVATPPPDHLDVAALVGAGRRRVRTRRTAAAGGVAVVAAGALIGGAALTGIGPGSGSDHTGAADRPTPDAPTIRLSDAAQAVEGRDYRVVTSYTNRDLDQDNGQYLDGVTDDGLVLFRDGPRSARPEPRLALLDPATGHKDWLPDSPIGQAQTWPVELDAQRLVLLGVDGSRLVAYVFDRGTREWTTMRWQGVPKLDFPHALLGPQGRLYFLVPATTGQVPEGGWPVGPDGEAEDADAEGDTYHLWSASLTDSSDVRDEALSVGEVAFTDSSMVWTDSTNGAAGRVHVRDLATGAEHSFDPHAGERCNLLSFGATDDRVMLSEYCGTYAGGVRDDRVQILTTDGDQVTTLQDSGVEGWLPPGSDVVDVTALGGQDDPSGTYVYDLSNDRFLRVSDAVSKWSLGGPTGSERQFFWHTPVNHGHGATQWLGTLTDPK